MKASIMQGQWEMELPQKSDEPWFLDWVLRSPAQAGKHLACGFRAFESLLDIYKASDLQSAWEPFGGIGAQALMAEYHFDVKHDHLVADYNLQAVEHLRRVLPIHINVEQADAYSQVPYNSDLVSLDFGDLTAWKAQADKPHGDLLSSTFAMGPRAVLVTDIAARYLHLQKKSYEPILGKGSCDSYESYLAAFAHHLQDRYGYAMHEAHYTHWSAVISFVPEEALSPTHSGRRYKLPSDYTGGLSLK